MQLLITMNRKWIHEQKKYSAIDDYGLEIPKEEKIGKEKQFIN